MRRVFLSFQSPDRTVALELKSAIESALPGTDVFVDQTHLRHGQLWQPALSEAIAKAQAFLILVSNRVGDWQKYEYYEARDRKAHDDAFILLPVIIADPARGPAANLPGLPQFHWIESTEPTAPDQLAQIVAALEARDTAKPPQPWRTINPYRGLVALEEQDADFFFGRERETAEILDRTLAAPGRLIALIGNSGVGKSSLVQAGVIGSLKRQRWPGGQRAWPQPLSRSRAFAYLTMKPGKDPIGALMSEFVKLWFPDATDPRRGDRCQKWAERLREPGGARLADVIKATDDHLREELGLTPPPRILLYIDQGEQLYIDPGEKLYIVQGEQLYATTRADQCKLFSKIVADGLETSPQRLIVMTSQRADYFGELQANASFFDRAEVISVPPLNADNLSLVLREPARVLGVGFESDDLVGHLVKSAEDQPGALPLLADLFTDLWKRMRERGDATLRISDRREIVQVGAALSRRAEKFLAENPGKVESVKRLFTLRLAYVPRQGEPVGQRWQRDQQPGVDPAVDAQWALVEQLAEQDWRLTVTGEKDGKATAEIAHEILLKTWPSLQRWLEEEREFLVWRGELEARRKDFEEAGKAGPRQQRLALLWGLPLDTAKKWLEGRRDDIETADREFIEASIQADSAAARNRQRLQAAVGLLMFGIILGLVGWIEQTPIADEWRFLTVTWPYERANVRPHVLNTAKERALKPGKHFRECPPRQKGKDYCPTMVVVPAGSFMMEFLPAEKHIPPFSTEIRQHKVTFAKSFAVSKYEVTFAEWDTCATYGNCAKVNDSTWGRGERPVINVTWNDAQTYVAWLSEVTGKHYTLLTDAEYEYAARGCAACGEKKKKKETIYPWGNDIKLNDKVMANCKGCSSISVGHKTAPVGSFTAKGFVGTFPANAFGLHDMVGNVWEWTEDCWHKTYNGAPKDGSAWLKADGGICAGRVVRGGGFDAFPAQLRLAYRYRIGIPFRDDDLGFRVARTLAAGAGAITVAPGVRKGSAQE